MIPTGLAGSEQALASALAAALGKLDQGSANALTTLTNTGNLATDQIDSLFSQAMGAQQPYGTGGGEAARMLAAYSGALGTDAQQQAFDGFTLSPAAKFLQEQSERTIARNASATGNLGGGNLSKDLVRFSQGFSAQQLADQLGQLSTVANRGMTTANNLSSILGNKANLQSNLVKDIGFAGANILDNQGRAGADLEMSVGGNVAAGRTRAGEQIGNQITSTATALSNLASSEGSGIASILGAGSGNLANLLTGLGRDQSSIQQQLATMLANISTGQGTQMTGLPGIPGVQQSPGMISGIGQAAGGIGGLLAAMG